MARWKALEADNTEVPSPSKSLPNLSLPHLHMYLLHAFTCLSHHALSRWQVQEIFTVPSPISLPDTMARVKATVIPALHIGVAAELDTDATCTGCCSFRTGTCAARCPAPFYPSSSRVV